MRATRDFLCPRLAIGAAAVLLLPSVALANAGGAMMNAFMTHFVFGNVILGVIEGILLRAVVRWRWPGIEGGPAEWGAIGLMVVANFASFILAVLMLPSVFEALREILGGPPIDAVAPALVLTWATAYGMTVVIEWPACWLVVRKGFPGGLRTLAACAAVNALTYLLLLMMYGVATDISLVTGTARHEPSVVLSEAPAFDLYVVEPDSGAVRRLAWDSVGFEEQAWTADGDVDTSSDRIRLLVTPPLPAPLNIEPREGLVLLSSESANCVVGWVEGRPPVLMDRAWRREPPVEAEHQWEMERVDQHRSTHWELRPELDRDWYPVVRGDLQSRVSLFERDGAFRYTLGMRAAPRPWSLRRLTTLPGDVLILEIEDMVLALHVPTKRLAYLCEGRSPVVMLRGEPIE